MKKKQGKKKKLTNKKKISESNAFKNIERNIPAVTLKTKKPNGIPKYVADRMAKEYFLQQEYQQLWVCPYLL